MSWMLTFYWLIGITKNRDRLLYLIVTLDTSHLLEVTSLKLVNKIPLKSPWRRRGDLRDPCVYERHVPTLPSIRKQVIDTFHTTL